MKLHSSDFERKLKRGAKQAVKNSPALKKELRATRKFRKQYQAMVVARPLISAGMAGTAWLVLHNTGHLASSLAVVTLWGLLFVFIHAQRLRITLYGSTDLLVLSILPLSASTVFRWELQKTVISSLWSLLDFVMAYSILALSADFPPLRWVALLLIAIAAWVEVLALASLGVCWFPRFPYQLVSSVLIMLAFGLLVTRDLVGDKVIALLDSSAPGLNTLLPTGWPASIAHALFSRDALAFLAFLVPTAAVIASLKSSIPRLRAKYHFQEIIMPEARDLIPDAWQAVSGSEASRGNRAVRLGPTAIEEIVESRKFLAEPEWRKRGFLEKTFWSWCTPRQRTLTEFVFPNGLAFTRAWLNIFRNVALSCLAALGAGFISPTAENWVFAAGLFVTGSHAFSCVLSNGRAFQAIHCSGVNIPIYANYPIGFHELGAFFFKHTLVQFPALLLFSVTCCLAGFYHYSQPLLAGAVCALKLAWLLVASRFIFLTFAFSSGSNDTSSIRFGSVLLILVVVFLAVSFLGLGAAGLFWPGQAAGWLCCLLASLEAYALFRCYGWFYHRKQFDLMSLPRQ